MAVGTKRTGAELRKRTEAGTIPVDWDVRPLGACLRRAPQYGVGAAAVPYSDALPTYIRITDISDDGRFLPAPRVSVRHPAATRYYLQPGDLVFARTGASVGKSYAYRGDDGELVFAGFLIRITPHPEILNPHFLAHYVRTQPYWDWVTRVSARSGQPGINGREYASLPVPLPGPDEQADIASALEQADALDYGLGAVIEKKKGVKAATAQQLLTGRTRLPGFEGAWTNQRLGDALKFLRTADNPRADLTANGDVEYIHYGDVHAHPTSILDRSMTALPRIRRSKLGRVSAVQEGDLVLVDASEDVEGVGKSVEVGPISGQLVVSGLHTILARGQGRDWAPGFKAYLQFIPAFRSAVARVASGISVYSITPKQIADIELELPSVPEQQAITRVLRDIDDEIATLEQRRRKSMGMKVGLAQALLSGRVRLTHPASVPIRI